MNGWGKGRRFFKETARELRKTYKMVRHRPLVI